MATKKKRKLPKPRKPPVPPKFSVGDQVRVKHGVPDADFPDIPLGGWAGIITKVDQSGSPCFSRSRITQFSLQGMTLRACSVGIFPANGFQNSFPGLQST
ncbi:MAG: hypothetical protein ABSG53_20370 [Thermoguttaceae bacterium]|jgi:uncharacterized protein YodC (DUF2158 family)